MYYVHERVIESREVERCAASDAPFLVSFLDMCGERGEDTCPRGLILKQKGTSPPDFSEKLLRTCLQTVSKFYVDEIGTYFGGLSNLTKMLSSTSTATRKL